MADSERFEYIKQPHIIALIIIGVLIIGGAIYLGIRRVDKINQRANTATEEACGQVITDNDLCKFIATSEVDGFKNYVSVSTVTSENSLQVTTLEVENPDRLRSITTNGSKETDAYVIFDASSYIKDYSDNKWAAYTEPTFEPSDGGLQYDFSSDTTDDTVEFRDHYKKIGNEPCGDLTCIKYEALTPDEPDTSTYIWFDTEHYLIRRYQSSDKETTTNIQYEYKPVTITAPSPTKEVSKETFDKLLTD